MTPSPPSPTTTTPRRLPRALLAAGLLLLAAFALRLWGLGVDGLWVDEAFTAGLCRLPLPRMWEALRADDAPALFYLLERIAIGLGGDSETMLRLVPALGGGATVLAAWLFARRHAPSAAGATLAAVGFSTLLVFYSRQARAYSLVHLFAVLLLWSAVALRREPSRRNLASFVVVALLVLYSHNLGVLLLAAAALSVADLVRRPQDRRGLFTASIAIAAGAIPWVARLLGQIRVHHAANQWMGAWWEQGRRLEFGPLYSWAVFANAAAPSLHPPIPLPGLEGAAAPWAWVGWIVVAVGLIGFLRTLRRGETRELGTILAIFSLVPLLGLVVISRLAGPAYVLGRTDTLALPAFLILIARGWAGWPRRVGPAVSTVWIALGLASLLPLWSGEARVSKRADRELAAALGARVAAGDAVVHASLTRPTLEYYARRQGWGQRLSWQGSFPHISDRNAAAVVPLPLDSAGVWQREALRLREEWSRAEAPRVWILAVRDDRTGAPAGSSGASPAWPSRPASPPKARGTTDAARVGYPTNVLVSVLAGLGPVPVELEYRQDWVAGERMLLRLDRDRWVSLDSIPSVEAAP